MNADSTFQIGRDHIVCQDYALAEVRENLAYAIVCDGCSASPDVDIGARILAISARETLLNEYMPKDKDFFGTSCIQKAGLVMRDFPHLHPQAMDSTLLVAWVKNNQLTAYLYGDGVFVHRSASGIDVTHISLSSGAPDYLSYFLDASRREAYDRMEDNEKEVWYRKSDGSYDRTALVTKPFQPVVFKKSVEEGDVVAVISDGINSFRKPDNTPIDWKDLVDDFTLIGPATAGVFIKRRMNMFKRKCAKELYTHGDDISIAAIIC